VLIVARPVEVPLRGFARTLPEIFTGQSACDRQRESAKEAGSTALRFRRKLLSASNQAVRQLFALRRRSRYDAVSQCRGFSQFAAAKKQLSPTAARQDAIGRAIMKSSHQPVRSTSSMVYTVDGQCSFRTNGRAQLVSKFRCAVIEAQFLSAWATNACSFELSLQQCEDGPFWRSQLPCLSSHVHPVVCQLRLVANERLIHMLELSRRRRLTGIRTMAVRRSKGGFMRIKLLEPCNDIFGQKLVIARNVPDRFATISQTQ